MKYVQKLLSGRMFPDFYQPAPVVSADDAAPSAAPLPVEMTNRVPFAEVLNSADEFYKTIAAQTSTRSFPRLTGSGLMVRGAYWMLNISEYPNEDDGYLASSLAEILETAEDWLARHPGKNLSDWESYIQTFYLSRTACAGILRRAEARGKEIKGALRKALESVAMSQEPGP